MDPLRRDLLSSCNSVPLQFRRNELTRCDMSTWKGKLVCSVRYWQRRRPPRRDSWQASPKGISAWRQGPEVCVQSLVKLLSRTRCQQGFSSLPHQERERERAYLALVGVCTRSLPLLSERYSLAAAPASTVSTVKASIAIQAAIIAVFVARMFQRLQPPSPPLSFLREWTGLPSSIALPLPPAPLARATPLARARSASLAWKSVGSRSSTQADQYHVPTLCRR